MVHITDTRTQKVVSYKSAHITQTVLAHDQHYGIHDAYILHSAFVFRTKFFENPGGRGSTLAPDPQNDNKNNILCR